jgi:predicted transcriptional regulator
MTLSGVSGVMQARLLVVLLTVLALALPAASQTSAPDVQHSADQAVQKGKSVIDNVVDGIGGAAKGVGKAAQAAGEGIGKAAGSLGQLLLQAISALGTASQAAASALYAAGAAVTLAFASAAAGAGQGLLALSNLVGLAAGAAVIALGNGLATAALWLGAQIAALAGLYTSLVGSLRPKQIPVPVFAAVATVGTAATGAAAGWGLWEVLRRWGWMTGFAVPGFTRIEDSELLKHPLRGQIFQIIQGNPGIHASELSRRMNVGWGTIIHHLEKLEKGRLVTARKVNNQKCFFEDGGRVSRLDMAVASAIRAGSAADIASFVQSHPMTSQKAMATELGISPALASFHVKKLAALGVLDKVRRGKETLLTTSDALRRVLAPTSAPAGAALAPRILAP